MPPGLLILGTENFLGQGLAPFSEESQEKVQKGIKDTVKAVLGTLEEVSPMPIDWATPDTTVWKEAIKNIPGREWNLLEANKNRFEEVRSTRFNLLPL